MGRVITAPGVLANVQGQIDHALDLYQDIKDNNTKPITITLDPVTNANGSYTHTTQDERITEDLKAVTLEVGTPEVFRAPVTISTADGSATLTCTNAQGTSSVTVTFVHTWPVDGGEDVPERVTSTEFDILADRIGPLPTLETTDKGSVVNAVNELNSGKAPNSHASSATTYGAGNASNYGHVKVSDTYNGTASDSAKAANSIAASQWALQTAYNTLNNSIGTVPSGQTVEGQISSLNSKTTIHKKTINKASTEGNYAITGVNPNNYVVIAAYEASGGAGAPCMISRSGNSIFVYLYQSNGDPYTGEATIDVYYVAVQ